MILMIFFGLDRKGRFLHSTSIKCYFSNEISYINGALFACWNIRNCV